MLYKHLLLDQLEILTNQLNISLSFNFNLLMPDGHIMHAETCTKIKNTSKCQDFSSLKLFIFAKCDQLSPLPQTFHLPDRFNDCCMMLLLH